MRQIHAIVNPAAGAGRARRSWPALARSIRNMGIEIIEHFTTAAGDAGEIAQQRILHNAAEVLAAGGDGTVNEVANGLLQDGESNPLRCVISILPLGSGCDLARNLGIRSIHDALRAIKGPHIATIDIATATIPNLPAPRYFLNSADIGLGACVAARVNRSAKWKSGTVAYLRAALREIISARTCDMHITIDGEAAHDGPALMALALNGPCYGGGMRASPTASMLDGMLEMVVVRSVSRARLACSLLPRVYRGTHVNDAAVLMRRGRCIEVKCAEHVPIALDGETFSAASVTLGMNTQRLRIRVPKLIGD